MCRCLIYSQICITERKAVLCPVLIFGQSVLNVWIFIPVTMVTLWVCLSVWGETKSLHNFFHFLTWTVSSATCGIVAFHKDSDLDKQGEGRWFYAALDVVVSGRLNATPKCCVWKTTNPIALRKAADATFFRVDPLNVSVCFCLLDGFTSWESAVSAFQPFASSPWVATANERVCCLDADVPSSFIFIEGLWKDLGSIFCLKPT